MITLQEKQAFVELLKKQYGSAVVRRNQIVKARKSAGLKPQNWAVNPNLRTDDGKYDVEKGLVPDKAPKSKKSPKASKVKTASRLKRISVPTESVEQKPEVTENAVNFESGVSVISYNDAGVPVVDSNYVKFGNYDDLKKIVQSEIFYPVFITGLSGNGKTLMVEQICAELKRKLFRVNITIETDEDDLIGGFRLKDGATVWFDGPAVQAAKTGSVLLLDEIDLASTKALCLQPLLEGKGIFVKKTNTWVKPADGFNVIATANTKGRGSESGKFIGTNVLNEAFLERFPITIEQDYPTVSYEKKILTKALASNGLEDDSFCSALCEWSSNIRRSYKDEVIDDVISTRRLVHVIKAYSIFEDHEKALMFCLNRFDETTKMAFFGLFKTLYDKEVNPQKTIDANSQPVETTTGNVYTYSA